MIVYETTFVVSGKYPDTEAEKLSVRFTQLITEAKGEIIKQEKLGKRELAYKIAHSKEGSYVYIEAKMDGVIVKELERNYRNTESILRYLTIKKVTHKPMKKKKKKVAAAAAAAAAAATTAAPAATTQGTPSATAPVTPAAK